MAVNQVTNSNGFEGFDECYFEREGFGGLRRTASVPSIRVVGFEPSPDTSPGVMCQAQARAKSHASYCSGGAQLASPLSQMLSAENAFGDNNHRLRACPSGDEGFLSADSNDGDEAARARGGGAGSPGDDAMGGDQMLTEGDAGFAAMSLAATDPIDIPYNAAGFRHWRR